MSKKGNFIREGVIHKSVQYSVLCITCDALEDYEPYKNQAMAAKYYCSLNLEKN